MRSEGIVLEFGYRPPLAFRLPMPANRSPVSPTRGGSRWVVLVIAYNLAHGLVLRCSSRHYHDIAPLHLTAELVGTDHLQRPPGDIRYERLGASEQEVRLVVARVGPVLLAQPVKPHTPVLHAFLKDLSMYPTQRNLVEPAPLHIDFWNPPCALCDPLEDAVAHV